MPFSRHSRSETELAVGGAYHYRVGGEYHLLNPETISKLQHAVRDSNPKTFREYTDLIDEQNRRDVHAARADEDQVCRELRCRWTRSSRRRRS